MWRPSLNFYKLHYIYVISTSLSALWVLYPAGNLSAINALFFGCSASTESGLNPVDLKQLMTYQQLFVYIVPIITNLGFVNIIVVIVRLFWFRKHLKRVAPELLSAKSQRTQESRGDPELGVRAPQRIEIRSEQTNGTSGDKTAVEESKETGKSRTESSNSCSDAHDNEEALGSSELPRENKKESVEMNPRITFDPSTNLHPRRETALYIPGPRARDQGHPLIELNEGQSSGDDVSIHSVPEPGAVIPGIRRRRVHTFPRSHEGLSLERVTSVASSVFVVGTEPRPRRPSFSQRQTSTAAENFPQLSRSVTIGRNSQFRNLSRRDREELGGIEYRSLKLLLKICLTYFFGLHLFGAICLVGWIQHANSKYRDYLAECGQDKNWWAFYSAQTMVDNLGFTLTPDSMVSFRDATFPMLLMSFLAFAGHTCYPVFLRLVIWTMSKLSPKHSTIQEPLAFLLNHPRRCYTLLFPSRSTWYLFFILIALNFVDTLLIIVLDLKNDAVSAMPIGPRLAAAIFQSVSSRHTGTASFNLADVNPAVQISLLVMMYISIFPIAMVIRTSNTYEERSLGIYKSDEEPVDENGTRYLLAHFQNQLSFDLWYIFLGLFCICIAESEHIMDDKDPAFAVFPIFFEVVSAYANVGLSLGYPTVTTSLSSQFSTFSKLVICAMMIRGRHRGLPYTLDRAILLPDERLVEEDEADRRE